MFRSGGKFQLIGIKLFIITMRNVQIFAEFQTKYVEDINPLKTSPEYTRSGVNGKCVL